MSITAPDPRGQNTLVSLGTEVADEAIVFPTDDYILLELQTEDTVWTNEN